MLFEIDGSIELGSSKSPRLKANEIHRDVCLKEVKAEDIIGKDGTKYETIYLRFENENGMYEHRFFPPTATESFADGQFGKQATDLTQFRYTIQHLVEALNPNLYDQIKKGKKFVLKTWKDMRLWVTNSLSGGIEIPMELKLIADNKGYATIPKYPVGVTKTGEPYMKTRFIGTGLMFTKYELQNIEAQKKASDAKPSPMSGVDFNPPPANTKTGDDFDV